MTDVPERFECLTEKDWKKHLKKTRRDAKRFVRLLRWYGFWFKVKVTLGLIDLEELEEREKKAEEMIKERQGEKA